MSLVVLLLGVLLGWIVAGPTGALIALIALLVVFGLGARA